MRYDLQSDEGLKQACLERLTALESDPQMLSGWAGPLRDFIKEVQDADEAKRTSLEFQQRLWEDNHVSSIGQGNISVEAALADESFRSWLARRSMEDLPVEPEARTSWFMELNQEILARLDPYCRRHPRLKVFRVLAALFPHDFTTISHRSKLKKLFRAMFGKLKATPVQQHSRILQRLTEVLGKPNGLEETVRRMVLPWLLFAKLVRSEADEDRTEEPASISGEERLVPLPAVRRRKGLTSIKGGFRALPAILDVIQDGVTREELIAELRKDSPNVKDSTLGMTINVLQSELAVIHREGDQYVLTERGEAVLDTNDPGELADWLLTRILGVDHVLVALAEGPMNRQELLDLVQSVNPGWTTQFAPHSIIAWMTSCEIIESGPNKKVQITESGREWRSRIHWTPEKLTPLVEDDKLVETEPKEIRDWRTPTLDKVLVGVSKSFNFSNNLIATLHAGLWAHERRHFAILTGLSGSGKTLLAREYGKALKSQCHGQSHTVAVQPGWYDPGSLLGYVNPLRGDAYSRTAFLDFLLQAADDPGNPYLAILDEMNLSHPEQYLAPLLSAMETGGMINLHREGEIFDGVPSQIPYPSNLCLIGTVNMDETTHGISDKVLDRAFVQEFWDIDLAAYPSWKDFGLPSDQLRTVRAVLSDLMEALAPARLHFGWRVVGDVLGFLKHSGGKASVLEFTFALDVVVMAKVLPKLRGEDSPRFKTALMSCRKVLQDHGLKDCARKVKELESDLVTMGTARFWR